MEYRRKFGNTGGKKYRIRIYVRGFGKEKGRLMNRMKDLVPVLKKGENNKVEDYRVIR